MQTATRRQFFGEIGQGMLALGLGSTLTAQLFVPRRTVDSRHAPHCGDDLEALIARMQTTAPDELQPHLVEQWQQGTRLETLALAGALANARTFGGGDYEGYHVFMALCPALAMTSQMPKGEEPLPLLKVLWRNSARIRAAGGGRRELPRVADAAAGDAALRERVRNRDLGGAERRFAQSCHSDLGTAWSDVQEIVRDDLNVHRIVLAWRAWDVLQVAGVEHADPLLRQCVRFCVDEEDDRVKRGRPEPALRADVPRILDAHGLLAKAAGERQPDDAWVEQLARTVFAADRADAADAVAKALADGFTPDAVAEAIVLAGNMLLLHDPGTSRVHGPSCGVHATDAANAWRHVARQARGGEAFATLVVAAYHTAGQSGHVGREPWAFADERGRLTANEPEALLRAAAVAIEQKDQRAACAAVHRYGELGHDAAPLFALLLRYAVSEDGALHAEKFFHTSREEFGRTRPSLRWRHAVALARVTASEFGEAAPGVAAARQLLA